MKKTILKKLATMVAGLSAGFLLTSAHAAEPVTVKMCSFLFMGEGGPEHQNLLDYQAAAREWGAKVEFVKTYQVDKIAAEEFKSGTCDIVNLPSITAAAFNKFTGTLDAPAAIPSYEHMRSVMQTLAKPSAQKYMRKGDYEIIGILPIGSVFMFTRDKTVTSLTDLAGKKMAVLDTMPEMRQLVVDLGMTPVSSTITNMYQKFNNGAIDITAAPAMVYDMMELYKGLRPNGGVLDKPIVQSSMQFVGRWENLPEEFAQRSREYFVKNFDATVNAAKEAEKNIPKDLWIPLSDESEAEYATQTRKIRLAFREQDVYDPKMLKLLRQIRCHKDGTLAECTDKNAE